MSQAEQYLQQALDAFDFGGQVVGAVRYGSGHINDTFCVHTQPGEDPCRRFILQRISAAAFHHPDQVMANIVGVTSYLGKQIAAAGGDPERETMSVYATRDGKSFYTDAEGGAWRVYPFIEGTVCLQSAETPELFAASALAFGNFQRMLKDYPADTLYETIPRFHDTEDRLAKLKAAVTADPMGRVKEVGPELDFVTAREADCSVALQALREGNSLKAQTCLDALCQMLREKYPMMALQRCIWADVGSQLLKGIIIHFCAVIRIVRDAADNHSGPRKARKRGSWNPPWRI